MLLISLFYKLGFVRMPENLTFPFRASHFWLLSFRSIIPRYYEWFFPEIKFVKLFLNVILHFMWPGIAVNFELILTLLSISVVDIFYQNWLFNTAISFVYEIFHFFQIWQLISIFISLFLIISSVMICVWWHIYLWKYCKKLYNCIYTSSTHF